MLASSFPLGDEQWGELKFSKEGENFSVFLKQVFWAMQGLVLYAKILL